MERDGAHSDAALHSARAGALNRRQRAFATELVLGSLRWRGELDHAISGALRRPLERLDAEVLTALRLGAYQLRHMAGVPPHAAVSQAVELARHARKHSAAPLVNAVLRNLPPAPPPAAARRLSHPGWLVQRWASRFAPDGLEALLAANLRRPETYFRIPSEAGERAVRKRLRSAGIDVERTGVPRAYRLASSTPRAARRAAGARLDFLNLNSQRVGRLAAADAPHLALDLCAAPGGKARILSEATAVVAADLRPARLRTLRRLGDRNIAAVAADAERSLPFTRRFHRILADVPCSGTGTLARNPEIKWRLQLADLADLQRRQRRILNSAMDALAPGGALIYSTCSLEPEENEQVVGPAVRARPGWRAEKVLCTVPGTDPGEGFQAWRIRSPSR